MSINKLQAGRALSVIPSDDCDIPFVGSAQVVGTNTSAVTNKLVMSTATFLTSGVKSGDIVYNNTDLSGATVDNDESETTNILNADIFTATSKSFTVYQSGTTSGYGAQACVLYIGGLGDVSVITEGGDAVVFVGLTVGSFFPVKVIRVLSTGTTATSINALW